MPPSGRKTTKFYQQKAQLQQENKFKSSDVNLNAQILRLQTIACLKYITNIWYLDQEQICTFFQNYNKLPLSKVQAMLLFQAPGTRIIKTQNKIYLGQISNKKKHGTGISIYKDGRVYQGDFYQNQKNGYGCQLYGNGNLFVGYFSQNKKHGKGSFYWFSLCTPACTKQASSKIEQYHGDWWGGLPDGEGEHQKANGDYYIGGFKNGLKHGNGIQYYANGDVYKGEYINGLAEGYGQYLWIDGCSFKGDFKQGYRNGYGAWESKGGTQNYKGHYLLDRKHGFGVYSWSNGAIYKGQYIQDLRSRHGELYQNGQLVYDGQWENGQRVDSYMTKMTSAKMPLSKTQKNHSNSVANSNVNFRVKDSKINIKSTDHRKTSATVKKDSFQVNFKLMESRLSTHRGCQACNRRPSVGQYSQKFRRKNNFINPQLTEQCVH